METKETTAAPEGVRDSAADAAFKELQASRIWPLTGDSGDDFQFGLACGWEAGVEYGLRKKPEKYELLSKDEQNRIFALGLGYAWPIMKHHPNLPDAMSALLTELMAWSWVKGRLSDESYKQ